MRRMSEAVQVPSTPLQTVPPGQTPGALKAWLGTPVRDVSAVYCETITPEALRAFFRVTEEIFSDLDGTLMEDPREFRPDIIDALGRLNRVGLVPTFVTGKPLSEARGILDMLAPHGVRARMLFERGAYELVPREDDGYDVQDILATREIEATITDLKHDFWREDSVIRTALERRYDVGFAHAGDGTHQCIFSLDILEPGKRVADSIDPHRMDIKVDIRRPQVEAMIALLRRDYEEYLGARCKGCTVSDLGNANLEITAHRIEKHLAIAVTSAYRDERPILLWGDSGNDTHMMELRRRAHIHTGVVLHEATPDALVALGDFFALGRGNGLPLINAVVEARQE